jgi:hypothetical protein
MIKTKITIEISDKKLREDVTLLKCLEDKVNEFTKDIRATLGLKYKVEIIEEKTKAF